ncbi:transporter substrate-binding domain-containing protein [Lentibacillus salicampi]|uniref:Amino acid ABC transporter substrate-binding protein n=1 Tax=Lentibacillus salicampi TaxID=175306 RepID=A0A4Y9A9W6_9BACI|nr:transporter substrate-binding domain-containing protein [Lentibacillus salicampi]TFJ92112.1 amino acid ABC transporter substrate-binding protein [Lentibacillus salicampi]
MKRITLLILMYMFVLAGCGGGEESNSSADQNGTNSDNSDSGSETLVVAMTHASPPNAFENEETGEPDGVMIDIIQRIAERTGYELEFESMPFSSLIPSLDSGRVDLIAAGMGITDERAEVVNFTEPVYGFTEALVVPAGNEDNVRSLEDLDGKSVGVSSGTFYHDYLVESDVEMDVKAYDTVSEMMLDLTNGRIHAAVNDTPIVHYLNENNSDYNVETVEEYEANYVIDIGLIIEQGNDELLNELSDQIDQMKEDGTLDEIHEKWGTTWFGSDDDE